MLVDSGGVGEGVGPDDGLVGRGAEADACGQHLAGGIELVHDDVVAEGKLVVAGDEDGGELFERGVTGADAGCRGYAARHDGQTTHRRRWHPFARRGRCVGRDGRRCRRRNGLQPAHPTAVILSDGATRRVEGYLYFTAALACILMSPRNEVM